MTTPLVSDWVAVSITYGLLGGLIGGLASVSIAVRISEYFIQR